MYRVSVNEKMKERPRERKGDGINLFTGRGRKEKQGIDKYVYKTNKTYTN